MIYFKVPGDGAACEFTIPPRPKEGKCKSFPFIPTVPVVLSFFEGKIGIYESFMSDILKNNVSEFLKGGGSFESASQFIENINNIPSGVGLEALEKLLLRSFGEGFKPILELVYVLMDLLKLIEDVICRVLAIVFSSCRRPHNIKWALNSQDIKGKKKDSINGLKNKKRTSNVKDIRKQVEEIQTLIDKASEVQKNSEKLANEFKNNPDLAEKYRLINNCALCDIEILKGELQKIKCNLDKIENNNDGYTPLTFNDDNLGVDIDVDDLEDLNEPLIQEAIYLGYFDKYGEQRTPPDWIKKSKKWKGQFNWIKDGDEGVEMLRKYYIEKFEEAQKIAQKRINTNLKNPYSNVFEQIKKEDDLQQDPRNIKEEDLKCCDDDSFSRIERALDKYARLQNPSGPQLYQESERGVKDMRGVIGQLMDYQKNFNYENNLIEKIRDKNFKFYHEEINFNELDVAINGSEGSQLGSQWLDENTPYKMEENEVPRKIIRKIMKTYGIDPEESGRIRLIKVINSPLGGETVVVKQITNKSNRFKTIYNHLGAEVTLIENKKILPNCNVQIKFGPNEEKPIIWGEAVEAFWAKNGNLYLIKKEKVREKDRAGNEIVKFVDVGFYLNFSEKIYYRLDNNPNVSIVKYLKAKENDIFSIEEIVSSSEKFSSSTNEKTGTMYSNGNNIPNDINKQLFLRENEDPTEAPLYNLVNKKPFEIWHGLDPRDTNYFLDLFFLSKGLTRRPKDEIIKKILKGKLDKINPSALNVLLRMAKIPDPTGLFNIKIDKQKVPTHYWLVELLPGDPSADEEGGGGGGAAKNKGKSGLRGKKIVRIVGRNYRRKRVLFSTVPIFLIGMITIISGRLMPLMKMLIRTITNPVEFLGSLAQLRLAKDFLLFSPKLTIDPALKLNYVYLDAFKKILSTVIDGVAVIEIPGLLTFGFDITHGRLRFIFKKGSLCFVPSPIVQTLLSMITLPIQLLIQILKAVFDFLKGLSSPFKLLKAVKDFLSFKWLLRIISPVNILGLLGINFKSPLPYSENLSDEMYDPINEVRELEKRFSEDMEELGSIFISINQNPNFVGQTINRSISKDTLKDACMCLPEERLKIIEKAFPNETQMYRLGDTEPLTDVLDAFCDSMCFTNNFSNGNEVIDAFVEVCGGGIEGSNRVVDTISNVVIQKNLFSEIKSETKKEENDPYEDMLENLKKDNAHNRKCIDFKIKSKLLQLVSFSSLGGISPFFLKREFLSLDKIKNLDLPSLKLKNPMQFAFIPPNINLSLNPQLPFSLQMPKFINLNIFLMAPFFFKLPIYTVQELVELAFLPLEVIASFIKFWEDIINGIIAFVLGCFGLDCILKVPKLRIHCLVPKFVFEENFKIKRVPRCDPNAFSLEKLPIFDTDEKNEASNLFDGLNPLDINYLNRNSNNLSIGSGPIILNELIRKKPEIKPLANNCGCETY